jgi:Uma2 family endonuclease
MRVQIIERPPQTLFEVFKSLPEGTPAQLIKNNIIMSPSPLVKHQKIVGKLYHQIEDLVENKDLGQTLIAPMDVYFDKENIFQPDILFISNENSRIIGEDGIYGPPDLIIEILSPSTARFDLKDKKEVYEQYGVKEYWIVDPDTKLAEGYFSEKDVFKELEKGEGVISSRLLKSPFRF